MLEVHFTGSADYGQYLSVLIAGPPGHGKTRFAATAKDPFFLDAEGGLMSIADKHIPAAKIESSEDLFIARNILSLGPEKAAEILTKGQVKTIGTVVIDTFDEVSRILIRERMEHEGSDTMKPADWMWLGDQLNAIIRGFRGLDMHVIFCSHIKDQTDGETGKTYYKLDIAGATAHQLPAAVELSLLLRTREVLVPQEGSDESIKERQAVIYTRPDVRHEWIKDRGGRLDDIIELDFVDDFQRIVATVYKDVDNIPEEETITVEFELEKASSSETVPTARQAASSAKESSSAKAEEKAVAVEKADQAVADAEARAKDKAAAADKPQLASETDLELEYASVDLDNAEVGSVIQVEGEDIPNGFQLNKENVGTQVRKSRFVYEVNGNKVLSRNQLEPGINPIPNEDVGSGIFCQATGVEITKDEANVSLIRLHQMVCEDVFEQRTDRTPAKR